jgi:chromosome segregation ATPase
MANPRDLAEQAIALLQSALSESEARASDLDEQLKRKRQPKNRLEEQLDVLTHRLENVEAERVQWEQKAGHLEEVAEAERAKVAQLKKKLEIAESGPDKLTKKEINFWRAKAEAIDAEIAEYKNRLTALRRELNERDEAIVRLEAAAPQAPADAATPAAEHEATEALRQQLEQRDRWLAELRLELHQLKAEPTVPLETDAEMETLRARVRGLEQSLGTATNTRAGLEADLARAQFELAARERTLSETNAAAERQLADRDRTLRETITAAERDRAALMEREHRLVELSAEVEHLRHDLRSRMEQQRGDSVRQAEQAAASEREVEALRMRLDQDRQDAAAAHAELQGRLIERERELEKQRQLLAANDTDFRELRAQLTDRETALHEHRSLLADREQALAVARRQLEAHAAELEERERERADRGEQLRALRQTLADRDRDRAATSSELEKMRAAAGEREQEIAALRAALETARAEVEQLREAFTASAEGLAEIRTTLAARTDELAAARTELEARASELATARTALIQSQAERDDARAGCAARERELEEARSAAQSNTRELERARATLTANEREVTSLRDTLLTSSRELDELRAEKRRLVAEIAETAARADDAVAEAAAAREQIAGLETELKEEREHAESLSELANERRDHMTKLQEQVEEAEERYAEASWKLGKSQHFQRIVKRRRGLVVKLLDALRAKMKANTALKAGLDGLRKYKAAAEENQQKLLQRMDQIKAELNEAEEAIKRYQSGTAGKEQLAQALARATALEERLNVQAELIQTLETDLKTARLGQKAAAAQASGGPGEDKQLELEQLRKELEMKSQIIQRLQTDADEQQRKLAKLRGSESETTRLKALTEKDRSEIDTLQRTVKDHEATIKKLTESAEAWKRKYQFLATDSPEPSKNGEK